MLYSWELKARMARVWSHVSCVVPRKTLSYMYPTALEDGHSKVLYKFTLRVTAVLTRVCGSLSIALLPYTSAQ